MRNPYTNNIYDVIHRYPQVQNFPNFLFKIARPSAP